jgi:outer membrane protein OmpA-like peptidoglycan-associated protein
MLQMKKRALLPVLMLLCLCFNLSARSREFERKLGRAQTLYENGNYGDALKAYLELYRSDSNNVMVSYHIGSCFLKTGDEYTKAAYYLGRAIKINELAKKKTSSLPKAAYRMMGEACHLNSDFDAAIANYEKYKKELGSDITAETAKEVNRKIEMCNHAKELIADPVQVQIVNLGKNLNSPHADYAPRLSADQCTMIFTSCRAENTGGNTYDGGKYFEDIYIATRKDKDSPWNKAVNLGWPVNTVDNEGVVAISPDGQEILLYKDDLGDGNIYSSKLEGDKWTVPVKLNSNINSKYWEPCAFISSDGNAIYFVSDRPGGYGGTDIYKSVKDGKGEWGPAVNLGPAINTVYDEYSPFIHPDGVTLYFSSKGHNSMGGYDVFYSRTMNADDKTWLAPTNIGFPVNGPGDEAFYMVSPDKQRAYYTSYREGGYGEKDNYMIIFPAVPDSPPISLLQGTVLDFSQQAPPNAVITVIDNETGEIAGVYHPNTRSGKYLLMLTPGNHNIIVQADGSLFYSDHYYVSEKDNYKENSKDIKLEPIGAGSKVVLNNVYFDFDQSRLRTSSKVELNSVIKFLKLNPGIKVEVSGFADSKGNDEYNQKLSLERAKSVIAYLTINGIETERLKASAKGKISAEAGENALNEKENGGRQLDRRVELRILALK